MTHYPLAVTLLACWLATASIAHAAGELPSWNDGQAKQAITAFVAKVTKPGTPDFVPVAERMAVFDNDGTLWAEQPLYFQFLFAIDRVKALSPQHAEWQDKEPFASLLRGDLKAALAGGEHALDGDHGRHAREPHYRGVRGHRQELARHCQASEDGATVHADGLPVGWAYDRQSSIGRLDKGLTEAQVKGWTAVSMKDDWKAIFPPQPR